MEELFKAVQKLLNEVHGIADLARPCIGNTGVECLFYRCVEVEALLKAYKEHDLIVKEPDYKWFQKVAWQAGVWPADDPPYEIVVAIKKYHQAMLAVSYKEKKK